MKRITTRVLTLAAVATFAGACAAPPGTVSSEKRATVTSSEPAKSAVCGTIDTPDGPEPTVYMYSAMNHKLGYYPELAKRVGLDTVATCEQAERFLVGYAELAAENPEFDATEPLDDLPEIEAQPPPDNSSARIETQKIFLGPEALNNPVVEITFDSTEQGGKHIDRSDTFGFPGATCTGTFVAKNWIVTAAHCMTASAVYHCIKDGINPVLNNAPNPACTPAYPNYGQWSIQFKLQNATLYSIREVWAIAYVNSRWLGKDPRKDPQLNPPAMDGGAAHVPIGFSDNDVALLYIGEDGILPPHVEEDGAKRISTVLDPKFTQWTIQGFGWGTPGSDHLRTTGPNGLTFTLSPNKKTITGVSNMAQASLCPGDSGGPLLRMNTPIKTNTSTTAQPVQVIIGIASTIGLPTAQCETGVIPPGNRSSNWANVAYPTNLEFIKEMIRRWNGNPISLRSGFKCRERAVENDGSDLQVAECWGVPCTQDSHCKKVSSTAVCSRAGKDYSFCPTCDSHPEPACGCMIGQCLPDPKAPTPPPTP